MKAQRENRSVALLFP